MTRDNTTTYREQGRAVILAALMVLSVVAMSAAFAGGAAAISDNTSSGEGITANVTTTGVEATHTANISVDSGDGYLSSNGGNDQIDYIDVDYSNFGTPDTPMSGVTDTDVTVYVDGTEATVGGVDTSNPAADGGNSARINLQSAQAVSDGSTVIVEIDGVTNPLSAETDTNVPVTLGDSEVAVSETVNLPLTTTQPNVDVEPNPGAATVGSTVDYTVTVTDSNDEPIEGVDVEVSEAGTNELATTSGLATTDLPVTITTDASGEATQALTNTTAAGVGIYDADFTEQLSDGGTFTTVSHQASGQDTAYIDGDIGDDNLNPIQNDGSVTISVTDNNGQTIVDEVQLSDFDTLASNNGFVESAGFTSSSDMSGDQRGEYYLELGTAGDTTYTFEANAEGFEAFDGDVTVSPGQQGDRNLRLTRTVDADRLTLIDDGELETIEGDLEDGEYTHGAPAAIADQEADLEGTVSVNAFVETTNTEAFNTAIDEHAPYPDDTVDVTVDNVDNPNTGTTIDTADVIVDPSRSEAVNENGSTAFDVSLNLGGDNPDDFTENIAVDLTFTADSNASVSDELTVTFVPEVDGTGTISGQVDELAGDDSDNNVEPADTQVYAVQSTDFDPNTATISNEDGLSVEKGDTYRVVSIDDETGDTSVEDARVNYLVSTDNGVEVMENESSFEIASETDATYTLTLRFLQNDSYQLQEYNQTSGEFETVDNVGDFGQTVTVEEGDDVTNTFEATEDLTYDAIASQYDEDPVEPVDMTNSLGNFELYNLPANNDYVVIAGGVGTEEADTAHGYADFRGFDTVSVHENADGTNEQKNADLTVEEVEIDTYFDYDLDVELRNEDGEFVSEDRIETGEETEVGVFVEATNQDNGNAIDAENLQGQQINLTTLDQAEPQNEIDPDFGELADTELEVDHIVNGTAYANTTFTADGLQTGTANISASTTNDRDQVYETRTGAGANDRSDQAQVEVYSTVEITGDVVNENDDNIGGAVVLLFDLDEVDNPAQLERGDENVTQSTVAGAGGSYVFTGVETGNDYGITAIAQDSNGNEVSNTRTLNNGNSVQDALGGEDIVITGASPDQPLQDAVFTVSSVDSQTIAQGDDLTVTADVENTGAIDATQDVTLAVEDENGNVTELDSTEVTLEAGGSTSVEFTVANVGLEAGEYDLTVSTDDSEATATLTVNDEDNDNGLPYTNDNGVVDEEGLNAAVTDYLSGDLQGGYDFNTIVNAYLSGDQLE